MGRAARFVIAANIAYGALEIAVAARIGSVSLFADSMDFLEDAAVNLLVLVSLGWSARQRARVGSVLAAVLLAPGCATVWTAWSKFGSPDVPPALPLSATGLGALLVNLGCALVLARWRTAGGSTVRAAFLSARNDVVASLAIIAAGAVTAWARSPWPDLAVGVGILVLNLDAAREVWRAAREERRAVERHEGR